MSPDAAEAAPGRDGPSDVVHFRVDGMRCDNCAAGIRRRLETLEGVIDARVSYALEDARVRFDPERLGPEAIVGQIEAAGFAARPDAIAAEGAGEDERSVALAAELADRKRRLVVGVVASGLVMALGMAAPMLGLETGAAGEWTVAALAGAVLFWVGREFHEGAVRAARTGVANMDTLVSLGASVAFFYSVGVLVLASAGDLDRARFPVYFESSAMIVTLVMVGKLLETRGKRVASGAVRALLETRPERARVERAGEVVEIANAEILPGDRVHVRPGERFPVDGVVVEGVTHVDESMLTGESRPVARGKGEAVHTGTVNQEGAVVCRATAVGEATVLADIARLVREAQATRAPIQSRVDRIAGVFVPVMIAAASLVGLIWWTWAGPRFLPALDPLAAGFLFAASTLLISCPCAMGLATPLALVAGSGVGAERGLLFKSAAALEEIGRLDTIFLDKTGTLTLGRPTVTAVTWADDVDRADATARIAALERCSEHPVARALVAWSEAHDDRAAGDSTPLAARDARAAAGSGIAGIVDGATVRIGRADWALSEASEEGPITLAARGANATGHATAVATVDGRAVACFAIGDAPDPSAASALARLRGLGLRLVMSTGDVAEPARAIAARLGLRDDEVVSGLRPAEKADHVKDRREAGARVAMVGDGLNDGPALASADVGIAIGSGTDVAIEAADVVLVRDDLGGLADAIVLGRRTIRAVRQNLFWAFGYNVAAIPLAAGLFVPWGGEALRLSPAVASLAMALSSLFVVTNSARLRRYDPAREGKHVAGDRSRTVPSLSPTRSRHAGSVA